MEKKLKILMIDDHPLILEGYRRTLQESFGENNDITLLIDTAHDCEEAFSKIEKSLMDGGYDMVFLDISLPPSRDKRFLSGEDLGREIRKLSPSTDLIVLTMYGDNLRLLNILKNLDPDAFLIKGDVTTQELVNAFTKVLEGEVHYSKTIINAMRKQITTDIVLDENDQSILHHLAEGVRTKDLVEKVPLSLAAIEKRKKVMKEIFEIEKGGDLALINEARKKGFL